MSTKNSQHLDDEVFLCRANGIMMQDPHPSGVDLSEVTGRISVKWQTKTASQEDVAMWGILAPPNDVRKSSILSEWMKKNKNRVNDAKKKLRRARDNIRQILKSSEAEEKESVEEV
ncbi:MAG: hypothetical protein ACTSUO_01055 [Candidatus Thorarchaeota archaeon]